LLRRRLVDQVGQDEAQRWIQSRLNAPHAAPPVDGFRHAFDGFLIELNRTEHEVGNGLRVDHAQIRGRRTIDQTQVEYTTVCKNRLRFA
jgi:hypothetical protein